MKITKTNDRIKIETPFNREFIDDLKRSISGCKWDGETWDAPIEAEEAVLNLMKEHFGYSPDEKMVTVKITAKCSLYGYKDSVYFNGNPVAYASGRDSGAKTADGVIKLSGSISSSGSVKNWRTYVAEGTQFKLEVPVSIATETEEWTVEKIEIEKSDEQKEIENYLCEMILQKYGKEFHGDSVIESLAKAILD